MDTTTSSKIVLKVIISEMCESIVIHLNVHINVPNILYKHTPTAIEKWLAQARLC